MTVLEMPTPDPRTLDDTARPFADAVRAHYAIKRTIGRGGMGMVFLARDRRLDRLVAIKTLLPELAADPVVRERFLRETRMAAGLAHPNIVPVHGADEIDGHVFYVMGFVDGDSLATHIRGRGALPADEVMQIMRDVATGLVHAHRRGVVHRDIKAENILIEHGSGVSMVTDFGIARLAEAGPLTATGQLLGTVHYVSPEQVVGETVDARSDLYSLGVVAYLALSGRFPFDADVASAVLVAHVTKAAPSLASVAADMPPALAAIVDRCLRKNPQERFTNAEQLLEALTLAMRGETSATAPKRSPTSPVVSTLVSKTEAQALWQRAADLQASTGIFPRPVIVPRERDIERDRGMRTGFNLHQLRDAANEAGIDAQYVEHALAEHGLAPASVQMKTAPVRRSWWAGVPLDVTKETLVAGEVAPRDFERIVNLLREQTGMMGATLACSREIAWIGRMNGSRLDISIVPDESTSIRASQNSRMVAYGVLIAALAAAAGIFVLVSIGVDQLLGMDGPDYMHILSRGQAKIVAVAVGCVAAIGSLPLSRKLFARFRRKADKDMTELVTAIADKVRTIARIND